MTFGRCREPTRRGGSTGDPLRGGVARNGDISLLLFAADKDAIIPYAVNFSLIITEPLSGEKLLDVEIGFF